MPTTTTRSEPRIDRTYPCAGGGARSTARLAQVAAGNRLLTNVRDYFDRLRGPRVIAVYCDYCQLPVKPRHISYPAVICRDCETAGALRTRYPIPGGGRR